MNAKEIQQKIDDFRVSRQKQMAVELFSLYIVDVLPRYLSRTQTLLDALKRLETAMASRPQEYSNTLIDSFHVIVKNIISEFEK